jgi:hypothetical protein
MLLQVALDHRSLPQREPRRSLATRPLRSELHLVRQAVALHALPERVPRATHTRQGPDELAERLADDTAAGYPPRQIHVRPTGRGRPRLAKGEGPSPAVNQNHPEPVGHHGWISRPRTTGLPHPLDAQVSRGHTPEVKIAFGQVVGAGLTAGREAGQRRSRWS